MISILAPPELLNECRRAVGLAAAATPILDDLLLGGLVRRSAGINCPCSPATLRSSLLDGLQGLTTDEDLSDKVDEAIEGLIVTGDLLELHDVVVDDSHVKSTWLFAAPPSFVVRPNGAVFLFGVVPDQESFLPDSLAARVRYHGYTRTIMASPNEDLTAELREQGLQQLSESAWLKCPKAETARDALNRFQRLLSQQPPAGAVSDAEIIDPQQPVTFYRGRWTTPNKQTGLVVGRRPQEFGAPLWCAMALENGSVARFIDLPLPKVRWRGCDAAWHLQMAIDACGGKPQSYRRRASPSGVRLDFFSPIPEWAERRLMIFGRAAPKEKCLFSYELSVPDAETEERFLQERLWLSQSSDSE